MGRGEEATHFCVAPRQIPARGCGGVPTGMGSNQVAPARRGIPQKAARGERPRPLAILSFAAFSESVVVVGILGVVTHRQNNSRGFCYILTLKKVSTGNLVVAG